MGSSYQTILAGGDLDDVLGSALQGPERNAADQHHAIVHALNFDDARPLTMKYREATASGRGV